MSSPISSRLTEAPPSSPRPTVAPANPPLPTVAVIGCGRIGRVHAANLKGRARLVFASRRPRSAREFAGRFGGEAMPHLDAVLARDDVSGVVLATPLADHAAQTVAALAAGKQVLVEKPLVADPAELDQVAGALEGHPPGALMVAENYLYKPLLRRPEQWRGAIGDLRRVRLAKLTRQRAPDWRRRYGALLEGGIHFVALLGGLIEEAPDRVEARFPGAAGPERRGEVRIRYRSGATGEIRYGWDQPSLPGGILQHSRIEGRDGRLVFESNGLYSVFASRVSGRWARFRIGPFEDLMGFRAMTRDFLRMLSDPGHRPRSDFSRARRDLELVFAAYRSAGLDPRGRRSPAEAGDVVHSAARRVD